MKRFALSLMALLLIVAVQAHADDMGGMKMGAKADANKSMTVQGEIVDLGCYLGHGAKGADHASCASECLSNGMPMGLLTKEGKLYLLTVSHDSADPFNQAKGWAAQQVEVTGSLMERDGMSAIEVDQVKQIPAAKPAKQG